MLSFEGDPVDAMMASLSHMLKRIPGYILADLFQAVVTEMFVRAESYDLFVEKWQNVTEQIFEQYHPDTTDDPDILADLIETQSELNEARARRFDSGFEQAANLELKKMFEEHGVIEGEDPEVPGLYL